MQKRTAKRSRRPLEKSSVILSCIACGVIPFSFLGSHELAKFGYAVGVVSCAGEGEGDKDILKHCHSFVSSFVCLD